MLAIISNRTLLIEMNYPFDINVLLHPNIIQWNYKHPAVSTSKFFYVLDMDHLKTKWSRLSVSLLNESIDMVELLTNLGLYWYYKVFNDHWTTLFHDMFGISQNDNVFSYGCVSQYLFTYDKRVTDAIDKEMGQLQLTPGQYVSVHYRSQSIAGDDHLKHPRSPIPYFNCTVSILYQLKNNYLNISKAYFISDSTATDRIANSIYSNQIVTSNVRKVHIDRVDLLDLSVDTLIDGLIGVLVNIEVAAKGAVFIRSGSTMADLIESIGQFSNCAVIRSDTF